MSGSSEPVLTRKVRGYRFVTRATDRSPRTGPNSAVSRDQRTRRILPDQ
jgi:hypothetical protein